MEKLLKQFAESATRWKAKLKVELYSGHKMDEFIGARIRLTFYYSLTALAILGGSSFILYEAIFSHISRSIRENIFDPRIAKAIINRAQDILLSRFITVDAIIVFFVIIIGFFIAEKTLGPIRLNMQKQKRFIADASHEFRTPIAVIISGLEVNLNNKNLDLPMAKVILENTLAEMREFAQLSNSLLDISKDKTEEFEPVCINELVLSVSEKNKSLARMKEINLLINIKEQAVINGNKMELERVFYNILDNAIKFTKPNGSIIVSDKIISNRYIVIITDNGAGISKDILGKIFDPFFRGDISRNTSGAGLGLTLVKKIIENHKGTIHIKSEEYKGTEAAISFPLVPHQSS